MKRFSISTWLAFAMLALIVPFLLLLWFLVAQLQNSEDEAVDRRTLRTAQSIARAIEPVIDSMVTTVSLVSANEDLAAGDLEAFYRRSRFALRGTGQFIIVADAKGRQLFNTRVDYGTPLGSVSDMESFETALTSNRPVVSKIFFGKTSEKWVFNVLKPLDDLGTSAARAAITTKNLDDLASAITELPLPDDWSAAIMDGHQNVFVSNGASVVSVTNPSLFPAGVDPGKLSQTPYIRHVHDDEEYVLAYTPIRGSDWNAVVWGPMASAQQPILQTWRFLIIGTMLLLVIMTLGLFAASKYFQLTVNGIARMALDLGEGRVVSPIGSRISEIDIIARALSNASFDRSEKERQLTLVMRELAHRTKNLMSVVLAIVRQSAKRAKTPRELVGVTADRIAGLGQSIDLLTASDWTTVSLRQLVVSQVGKFGTVGSNIEIRGPEFNLRSDAVQNLGMAFHELATNAAKYGALSSKQGHVLVTWDVVRAEDGDKLHLVWCETGGPPVTPPESTSFGTQILDLHVSATSNGKTEIEYRPEGLVWTLIAPVSVLERQEDLSELSPVATD